ncbi:hypothetical protein [Actinomyces sp.]|uniref:hypothetical protein n=1 Tax=Actinomyces sp. TaxID=29317 RepID=UPI00289C3047|nr:hypothetical protein [Actinomyces sp.]
MRFSHSYNDLLREDYFEAQPGEYDGIPPVLQLVTEWIPRAAISADRQAVVGALAFGRWVSGLFEVDSPVSVQVASAIRDFVPALELEFSGVALRPKSPHRSSAKLIVDPLLVHEQVESTDSCGRFGEREYRLRIHPNGESSGCMMVSDTFEVASNAYFFDSPEDDMRSLEAWYPFLAVAVLMSTEYEVGRILVPANLCDNSKAWRDCEGLLKSVDIALQGA